MQNFADLLGLLLGSYSDFGVGTGEARNVQPYVYPAALSDRKAPCAYSFMALDEPQLVVLFALAWWQSPHFEAHLHVLACAPDAHLAARIGCAAGGAQVR